MKSESKSDILELTVGLFKHGQWKPYRGPQGGEGWQQINDPNDVRYQNDAPGEIADGYEEQAEGWGESDSENSPGHLPDLPFGYQWEDSVPSKMNEGDLIEYEDEHGERQVGEFTAFNGVGIPTGFDADEMHKEPLIQLQDGKNIGWPLQTERYAPINGEPNLSLDPDDLGGDGMAMDPQRIGEEITFALDLDQLIDHSVGRQSQRNENSKQLSGDQKIQIEESLKKYFDPHNVDDFYRGVQEWQRSSGDNTEHVCHHAEAFKQALDIESPRRGGDSNVYGTDPDVSEEDVKIAKTMNELSRQFWEQTFDGSQTMYRGISNTALSSLVSNWLETPDAKRVKLKQRALNNYSTERTVARRWGRMTATIKTTIETDQVGFAADQIGGMDMSLEEENETHVIGDDMEVRMSDVAMGEMPGFDIRTNPSSWSLFENRKFAEYVESNNISNRVSESGAKNLLRWTNSYEKKVEESDADSLFNARNLEDVEDIRRTIEQSQDMNASDYGHVFGGIDKAMEDENEQDENAIVLDLRNPADDAFLSEEAEPGSNNWGVDADKSDSDGRSSEILDETMKTVEESRRYVTTPSEVPDGYDVQEGSRGGIYYETDSVGSEAGSNESDIESPWGGDSEWDQNIPEYDAFANDEEEVIWNYDKVTYTTSAGERKTGQIEVVEGKIDGRGLYSLKEGGMVAHDQIDGFCRAPWDEVARTDYRRVQAGEWIGFNDIDGIHGMDRGKVTNVELHHDHNQTVDVINVNRGETTLYFTEDEHGRRKGVRCTVDNAGRDPPSDYDGIESINEFYDFPEVSSTPPDLDPANAEDIESMGNDMGGISSGSMVIAHNVNGTGKPAYITNLNQDRPMNAEGAKDARRVMTGARGMKILGFDVPQHHREEGEYWTTAEANGTKVSEWDGDPSDVDYDSFLDLQAAAWVTGNWDLHEHNVTIKQSGELVPFDLDLSGHNLGYQSRFIDTTWGRTKSLCRGLGFNDEYEWDTVKNDIRDRTVALCKQSEKMQRVIDAAEGDDMKSNIERNIEAGRLGDLFDNFEFRRA